MGLPQQQGPGRKDRRDGPKGSGIQEGRVWWVMLPKSTRLPVAALEMTSGPWPLVTPPYPHAGLMVSHTTSLQGQGRAVAAQGIFGRKH